MSRPPKFTNPWPNAELDHRSSAFFRWQWQRIRHGVPPTPPPGTFPLATPRIARPRAGPGECWLTWLGHASFLLQAGGLNLLVDPVFSERASPFERLGPARVTPVPLSIEALPPIDAVLISHDHYDHLDERSVRTLHDRFGAALQWVAPLEHQRWFAKRDIDNLVELDWWQVTNIGDTRITATPAQHWSRRGWHAQQRLWCSFMIEAGPFSLFFGADSGYCPAFAEIGERFGGCDVAMLPIGAYEPRWFMRTAHMNPEEAVQSFVDLGARILVPMHWGTFRLTDEDMREPPQRARAAWQAAGLDEQRLRLLQHGETLIMEK